jgi:hypothetical protein
VDLELLAGVSGRLRTRGEWQSLFEKAGFRQVGLTRTGIPDATSIEIVKA